MVSKNKPRDYLKALNQSEKNLIARIREISQLFKDFEDKQVVEIDDLKHYCASAIIENLNYLHKKAVFEEVDKNE